MLNKSFVSFTPKEIYPPHQLPRNSTPHQLPRNSILLTNPPGTLNSPPTPQERILPTPQELYPPR